MKHCIVVADKFDPEGVARLRQQSGLEVLYDGGYSRDRLLEIMPQAQGLIIRSATRVDAALLERAPNLKIVIRAGVGVDNIDILESSRRGVIVMNAPGGNTVSTAEQALALLFALARKTPQANASMKQGKWEKSKFVGVELTGKTLGVVGLGRIGKEVVKRARGLQMNVVGYDPYIPPANLSHLEIDIVALEELLAQSDFVTVHTPLTDATRGLVNLQNLARLKDGVRLINCARGGIYEEAALAEGLRSGKIAAVALDVFSEEPPPSGFALTEMENCIMTPHLGASTGDAEFAVAMESVDQLIEYFERGIARNALNFPTVDPEAMDYLKPFFQGGEKVGRMLAHMLPGDLASVQIDYCGEVANFATQPVSTAILCGALSVAMGDEVNFVNAPVFARDRGIQLQENKKAAERGFSSYVHVRFSTSRGQSTESKFTSVNREPLVFSMFGLPIEFKPDGIMLLVTNRDVPRVVGTLGNFLGDLNINIAHLELSRDDKGGTAYCMMTVDDLLSPEALAKLRGLDNILNAVQLDLR
ncbi:MAG: phosphoglycerate dehydrogenase [Leptospirales bacterium]|nr:phosphoglycerate dehydrogenase [Leptospirales bacterium]